MDRYVVQDPNLCDRLAVWMCGMDWIVLTISIKIGVCVYEVDSVEFEEIVYSNLRCYNQKIAALDAFKLDGCQYEA